MSRYPFQRAYFRIRFPMRERPRLVVDGRELEVVDCSENGLRYRAEPGAVPAWGSEIQGELRFRRGATVEIEGTVVRRQAGEVALRLAETRIPLKIIFDEQRYLRAHYPMWPWSVEPAETEPGEVEPPRRRASEPRTRAEL
jgi:hypothetical protein